MEIRYVGPSTMHTVSRNLVPKDVLHVPNASKNPIYVHKLLTNNNDFSNFTKRLSS